MEPSDQDSGIHPESKTMLNKETKNGNNLLAEYFKNSLIIRSPPTSFVIFQTFNSMYYFIFRNNSVQFYI